MNCSNDSTRPFAFSFADAENAASITWSLLTVSMVCSNCCFMINPRAGLGFRLRHA